jgi:hypothetical protein
MVPIVAAALLGLGSAVVGAVGGTIQKAKEQKMLRRQQEHERRMAEMQLAAQREMLEEQKRMKVLSFLQPNQNQLIIILLIFGVFIFALMKFRK